MGGGVLPLTPPLSSIKNHCRWNQTTITKIQMLLPAAANFSIKIRLFHVDCLSWAYTDAAQSSPLWIKKPLYVMCWLLLRFLRCCSSLQQNHMTAERNRLRGGWRGHRLTVKVLEKKKKNPLLEREEGKKGGLKVFHFKNCGTTARNCCCNQNKPGATTVPGNEKDSRK